MLSAKLIRWSGLLAVLGGILWATTWILVAFTAGGTRDVFGLSERGWRTLLLNPAMVFFMAGLVGFHAKQAGRSGRLGRSGLAVGVVGLGTMILGNIIEFWVSELFYGTQQPGWRVMGVGFVLLPIGLLLLGIGTLKASVFSGWRRAVPFGFGVILAWILALLFLSDVAWMLPALSIAAGWGVLGCALWFDEDNGASRSSEDAG